MESKHTGGPWTADLHHTAESAGRTYGWVRGGDQLVPLAGVTLGVEGLPQDEGRANARLISAAPDLLEALRAMLDEHGYNGAAEDQRIEREARAAILKATGGAP